MILTYVKQNTKTRLLAPSFETSFKAFVTTAALIVLLATMTQQAHAEVLYKWQEPDGSITFSPTPPAAGSGIAFETIGAAQSGLKQIAKPTAAVPAVNGSRVVSAPPVMRVQPVQQPATARTSVRPMAQPSGSSTKSAHCNELKKRVISLERLLKTNITAETMDNAVVQMARYQISINQACKR